MVVFLLYDCVYVLKIYMSDTMYHEAYDIEKNGAVNCVTMIDCFIFERHGPNLLHYIKLTTDIIKGLSFLHDICQIIHTDIKPENIVFVSSEINSNIKIIDFNNACTYENESNHLIQTRQYRAPEVITNKKWNEKVDIWSVACMFYEMIEGYFLFCPIGNSSDEKIKNHMYIIQMNLQKKCVIMT